ncbi:MAG: DUF4038 domain-containing protein [Gemmataceae bacterium]|nr:DUF4038 domain-containing protein [Gemmataceae bacterium]
MTALLPLAAAVLAAAPQPAPGLSARTVEVYDLVELTVPRPPAKDGANPFDVPLAVTVTGPDGKATEIAGFCDSADGSVYRVRVMPSKPGRYHISGAALGLPEGVRFAFTATPSKRRGPVRVDKDHPYHFVWEGTGEHYFLNGLTTYWLLGVQDEARIAAAIDRFAKHKVNRIRVALNARTADGGRWFEPQVKNSDLFKFRINPWPARNPDSPSDPGLDTSRFDVALWQKMDRLVKHARDKDVVVSVIFHLDGADKGVDPFGKGDKKWPGSEDEWKYYRYGVARLSGYSNVMWDVTNEWHLFRNEAWTNKAGEVIKAADPVKHLASVHGHGEFPFYKSPWVDYAMYQVWDEHGAYKFLRNARELARKAGRPMPQVNEEYGYEDHYPGPWGGGRKKPARVADNRRRLAWEMSMAGGYQTGGERADEPGQGGWITGLGNDAMVMPPMMARMVDFFTAFEWWKCNPADGVADDGALVLADPGKVYAVYLPKGGATAVKLPAGGWVTKWYDPRAGKWLEGQAFEGGGEVTLTAPAADDWAALVTRK